MPRITAKDLLAAALFILMLVSGSAAAYVRWFSYRGVDGIIRDVVDDTLRPANSKPERAP